MEPHAGRDEHRKGTSASVAGAALARAGVDVGSAPGDGRLGDSLELQAGVDVAAVDVKRTKVAPREVPLEQPGDGLASFLKLFAFPQG